MAIINFSIFNQYSASALIKISFIITFLIKMSTSIIGKDLYTHKENATIQLTVGSMNSIKTQIPFDYYYLDICPPEKIVLEPDNLGEILTGDRSYYSKYQFKIGQNEFCQELCVKRLNPIDVNLIKWMINRNYTVNWYADKLPSGLKFENGEKVDVHYLSGVPLGYQEKAIEDFDTIIYNHLTFTVQIHKEQAGKGNTENLYTIVGFNVQPFSIHQNSETGKKCSPDKENFNKNFRTEKQKVEIGETLFTYDVIFEMSDVTFSSRWDHYLHIHNDSIHWFSLINSSLIIVIFSFIVLHIFMRALKKDIEIYNSRVTGDEFIDEFGWKQVCNDVFRRPANRMLFSALIGTGVQLFSMSAYSLMFASLGFLNPEKRGALLMIMILLFVFMGVFAGYYSTRFYKMFQGKDWLKNAFLTAFLYPALAFSVFFIINFMFWLEASSAALKFTDMLALLLLWLCCSSPLVLIGSFIGLKKKIIKNPCKVNAVPSQVPPKPWYLRTSVLTIASGLIPFAAIFIELVYIMASIWRHYIYWLFGFLFIVLLILIITCTEISIVVTYVLLCKGDYNWWWRSFFISASPALYVFLYSIYYFFTNLSIRRLSSIVIYFGSMTLLSSVVFLISGTMGFIFTYLFIRKIYSMIKID